MLLTLTTTHRPATDLGYLLAKNPARVQSFSLAFGRAHVFYPEACEERCTAALVLDVDGVGLVRRGGDAEPLAQYVNDRPYVASSFLSVAIAQVLASALNGHSRERQALVDVELPLVAALPVVPCRGGEPFLRALFEPLGYRVGAERIALDEANPTWGDSRYLRVTLEKACTLQSLLAHLYVLLPVLDDDKHYFVGDDEVDKLLRHGDGWLAEHPARDQIAARYLRRRRSLVNDALVALELARAGDEDDDGDEAGAADVDSGAASGRQPARLEDELERPLTLNEERQRAVVEALRAEEVESVLDLGCGEGRLLRELLADKSFTRIAGADVSARALESAARRLRLDRMGERQRARISLLQASLTYRDKRFADYDAVTLVEVIEHVDPSRLPALERVVFAHARPGVVVVTTPNVEHNALFAGLPAGSLRHRDHRFEWTRAEFRQWADRVGARNGYAVRFVDVGPVDEARGPPTQMGVFRR